MYNAFANTLDVGSKGSTRLHMDMADAVNIMTYAADTPDGRPGYAAWDIFRAQDSDKIRTYLREKSPCSPMLDPIHGQQYFLDEGMRRELWERYGVISHRILQRPGEAIFIPAGCAHQVSSKSLCCMLSQKINPTCLA
jgi:[histone H3]-dimethyl-L-lysine9 demethylase